MQKHYVEWREKRNESVHTSWFHFCEILEKGILIYGKKHQNRACFWWMWKTDWGEVQENFLTQMNEVYPNWSICTVKICAFHSICKLHPNLEILKKNFSSKKQKGGILALNLAFFSFGLCALTSHFKFKLELISCSCFSLMTSCS